MSSLSNTKLPLETWIEYAKGMIIGLSIRKNAKAVDVCVKISFYMRHKLLDCIREFMGIGDVDGVVEMDEVLIAQNFKGNHKKVVLLCLELHVNVENRSKKEVYPMSKFASLPL